MIRLSLHFTLWAFAALHLLALGAAFIPPPAEYGRAPANQSATWAVIACDDYKKDRTECGLVRAKKDFPLQDY